MKLPNLMILAGFLYVGGFYLPPISSSHSTALAHGDHSGKPIKADEASITAKNTVSGIVKQGKLEKEWGTIKANKPEKKDFGHGPEWVVTFDNPKAKDKKKQKLYVFLSIDGHVLGVNFTGN